MKLQFKELAIQNQLLKTIRSNFTYCFSGSIFWKKLIYLEAGHGATVPVDAKYH